MTTLLATRAFVPSFELANNTGSTFSMVMEDICLWLQQYSRLNVARVADPDKLTIELMTSYCTIKKLSDIDVSCSMDRL